MALETKYICCKCWKVLNPSLRRGASYSHNSAWSVPPLFVTEMCTDCIKKYHLEYYISVLNFEKAIDKRQRRKS